VRTLAQHFQVSHLGDRSTGVPAAARVRSPSIFMRSLNERFTLNLSVHGFDEALILAKVFELSSDMAENLLTIAARSACQIWRRPQQNSNL